MEIMSAKNMLFSAIWEVYLLNFSHKENGCADSDEPFLGGCREVWTAGSEKMTGIESKRLYFNRC